MDTTLLGLKNTESYIDDCITFSKKLVPSPIRTPLSVLKIERS